MVGRLPAGSPSLPFLLAFFLLEERARACVSRSRALSYSPSQFLSPTSSLPVGIFLDQRNGEARSLEARRFLTRLK